MILAAAVPHLGWAKKPASLSLLVNEPYFSPNKDRLFDTIVFEVKSEGIKSVVSWDFQIRDAGGAIKRTVNGLKNIPALVTWDGLDEYGALAPEGKYDASFTVWDKKLGPFKSDPAVFTLDLTPPTISLSVPRKKILLVDDVVQPINMDLSAVDLSGIGSWEVQIQDYAGKVLFVQSSTQPLPNHLSLEPGKGVIPLGKVAAILSVTDRAKNRGSSPPVELEILGWSQAPEKAPAEVKSAPMGKYLQLTAIISVADLFGAEADRESSLIPESATLLNPLAQALQSSPNARATILAHVDSQASREQAKALSSYFAWKTYSYFVKQKGIDKNLISVKGLGSDVPIAKEGTSVGRARNRRVEIQIFFPEESSSP